MHARQCLQQFGNCKEIANVRMEIAQLLGYDNFAEYNLKERMAQNSDAVYKLLNQLLEAYTPAAQKNMLKCRHWHVAKKEKTSTLCHGTGVTILKN